MWVRLLAITAALAVMSADGFAEDVAKHPWVLVGFTSFLLLIPLAVTSTNRMVKRLGFPRWKRLHRLATLSGGERALTGLALLFAIFYYRPSPFCVLDEVDAPLDDANIHRFIRVLRELCSQTQFVVITHNRKTMEAADVLYGVTMQEPGLSRLVSVKLTDA